MKAYTLFFPRRLRDLLAYKPRNPKEKAEQIDHLRALIPISMLLAIVSLGIAAAKLYRVPNHWTDYAMIFAFTGLAIRNSYTIIKARRILNEN